MNVDVVVLKHGVPTERERGSANIRAHVCVLFAECKYSFYIPSLQVTTFLFPLGIMYSFYSPSLQVTTFLFPLGIMYSFYIPSLQVTTFLSRRYHERHGLGLQRGYRGLEARRAHRVQARQDARQGDRSQETRAEGVQVPARLYKCVSL